MGGLRIVHTIVLAAGTAGGIYYAIADKEIQGVVVVLIAILYFTGISKVLDGR